MSVETILEGTNGHVVKMGVDHSFAIIGERINPTGRSKLGEEFHEMNFKRAQEDAIAQVEAGAKVLDINAAVSPPKGLEPQMLAGAIKAVQEVVDAPICIDTSTFEALEPALEAVKGKALINSVTGEDHHLEQVLPLVKKYGAAVIGMANDDSGISLELEPRWVAAQKVVHAALDFGIPREDIIIDPLAMPLGGVADSGVITFELCRRIREELDVNLSCGASNISFGMPDRHGIDAAFMPMVMLAGMAMAITNPLADHVRRAILAADVLLDHDHQSKSWIKHFRDKKAKEEAAAAGGA